MGIIPFNIKYRPQIESGEYKVVISKFARIPARILCWDFKEKYLIVEFKDEYEKYVGRIYTADGKISSESLIEGSDLFIITPEEELTEFEEKLLHVICSVISSTINPRMTMFEYVKVQADSLIRLAKKQLIKSPWIPASNPPDDDRLVFICVNDNGVPQCVGCGCYKKGVWVDAEDKLTYPDYWMEIPELSKEE